MSAAHVRQSRVRAVVVSHTEVGLALSSSDDCSYHSALVSKYGIVCCGVRDARMVERGGECCGNFWRGSAG